MITQLALLGAPANEEQVRLVVSASPSKKDEVIQDALKITLAGATADLTHFKKFVERTVDDSMRLPASSDVEAAQILHKALRDCKRRFVLDPRFWEWLSIAELTNYVVARWVVDNTNLTRANIGRFTCGTGVSRVATNALSRLYWTADVSWTVRGDYSGLTNLLSKADLHKTLFTNELCLQPRLCLAHVDEMIKGYKEKDAREMVKLLGVFQASTSYVSLSDGQLAQLVLALRSYL